MWDAATGTCTQVLEGHENGVCVVGLPNGDIVTVRVCVCGVYQVLRGLLLEYVSAGGLLGGCNFAPVCYVLAHG